MKPVDMQKASTDQGDCWRACLASILEVSLEHVPDFVNQDEPRWLTNSAEWLRDRRHSLYTCGSPLGTVDHDVRHFGGFPGYAIWVGTTERGEAFHAVVAYRDTMVHDPHPSRAGINKCVLIVKVLPFDRQSLKQWP